MVFLVVFTIFLFTATYYLLVFGEGTKYREKIGENQFRLYENYREAEKIMLYVEEASRLAAYDGILELAENGGYAGDDFISDCGKAGYNVWYENVWKCFPDVNKNFKTLFISNFDKYLENYNIRLFNDYDNPGLHDYYDFEIENGENLKINGISREKYILGNIDENKNYNLKYEIDPSFKQAIKHNLVDYNEIKIIVNEAIELCNTAECFERVVKKGSYDWRIFDKEGYVLFEVNLNKKIFNDAVVVKFAIKKNS